MKKSTFILSVIGVMIIATIGTCTILSIRKENSFKSQKLIKQNDSLNILVYQKDNFILKRDSIILLMEKRQAITDSLIVINHKSLKNEKNKIKNFTVESRNRFVDSLLKIANIRK